jgi:hypothetical protein
VPCATNDPRGASEYFHGEASGERPSMAGRRPVGLGDNSRGRTIVHALFRFVLVLAATVGVLHVGIPKSAEIGIDLEFTARIAAQANPKWLGYMAKAVPPSGVDGLLTFRRPW